MDHNTYIKVYHFLSPRDKEIKADLIIGFGHFDLRIAEQCAILLNKCLATRILFTGGFGAGSGDFRKPEAIEFQNYIKKYYPDIDQKNILIEKKSTNTSENIKNSIRLLKKNGIFNDIHRIILVATTTRQLRVYLTALKLFHNIKIINIPPKSSYNIDLKMYKKTGIDFNKHLLGELKRIKEYPKMGFISKIHIPDEIENLYKKSTSSDI
jgi:uncharacterized SAM-binding protein YcdF (DUF218 family)